MKEHEIVEPNYKLDIKKAACHHCGNECKPIWDAQVNGYVSDCHGVGFDYENTAGNMKSENDGLRYISDWAE
ncbi:hypothetical protein [Endozoicomonas lisbonensis]|uniref:Rieske Fe-S protein n=1 Tax=Endozoicomonas lisbonensis TaxID=3120522 RepID=A0ABV2SGU2_9GAMM